MLWLLLLMEKLFVGVTVGTLKVIMKGKGDRKSNKKKNVERFKMEFKIL